jgi:hypothetical protein
MRVPPSVKYGFYSNTLGANRVRLRLPPQAAPAKGRAQGANAPMDQSREAHHPARPLHSPEGAMLLFQVVADYKWLNAVQGAGRTGRQRPSGPQYPGAFTASGKREVLMAAGKIDAHEADRDIGLVRRLLAAQFPQWATQPIERVPSTGTDHALYRLGDDQVVRLPLTWGAARGLDKELTWLPRLAPLLPVAIPVVLGTGLPAEGYPMPWAVYRWLDGENPRIGHIADPDVLATDLAAFIAALQRVDLADGPAAYRGGPLATQDAGTRAALADLGGWSIPRRRPRRGIPRCGCRNGPARRSGSTPTSCQATSWSARDGSPGSWTSLRSGSAILPAT